MSTISQARAVVRKVPKQLISLLFILCVVAFFALYLRSVDWHRLSHLHFGWGYLIAATIFATAFRYWGVVIWRYILSDLGATGLPRFVVMAYVYAKAWMGRYIPGTVTWIAGKVYMASSHGISKSRLAVSSLLEGGMQIIAVMVVSMLLLGFDPRLNVIPPIYKGLMILCALCLLVILTPAIFNRIVGVAFKVLRGKAVHAEMLINGKSVIRSFFLYAAGSFILGLAEFFITRTIDPSIPWHDFWFIVGAFNIAGALGMLAIGVPSGLGVRDGAILLLLSAIMPKEIALAVTVTSRLWIAFADIVFFAVATTIHRLAGNEKVPAAVPASTHKTTLVVLASTYPRWPNDHMRTFVRDYVHNVAGHFRRVRVIVPHYKGARHSEKSTSKVRVTRFYYAFPFRFENIAYGEFKKTRFYPLKALTYNLSELCTTFWAVLGKRRVVINAHWIIPQGFVAVLVGKMLGCPVVVSVHGADVYTLNGKIMRRIKRYTLQNAAEVIVNSSATLAACRAIAKRPYHVIPMGVDTSAFTARAPKVAGKVFELLFVGRVSEIKGVLYLCEAVRLLRERHIPMIHATIIGDGDALPAVRAYVAEHHLQDAITLTGGLPHSQLAVYYANADAFVGPSIESKDGWKEAFGVVFAEAAAVGVPIIATATGGIKDIVHDGVNGLLVPQKDAGAIADAVQRLQQNPELCARLGSAGPAMVANNFSWQIVTQKYLAILQAHFS